MAILTAAVVLVGVLVLFDLLLTLGLVKRVRTHAEVLDKLVNARPGPQLEPGRLPPGTVVGEFAATTSDGLEVSRASFTDGAVLGFFSTWCETCAEQLPGFLAFAEPLGRERVLAVVHGGEDQLPGLIAKLSKVAQVVVEPDNGPIAKAVGVDAMPTMAVIDKHWRVTSSGYQADSLASAAI
ncbi:redoxin domain-containing protein [Streptomyces sp. SID13031]|uniref:TlpA family protein disulfide reductase n=1 Tax=Streptomyces sp. SID13031 TaxID=2706046 RepID=UPI0013C61F89|nr:redoxin domain-containing protein [Streptomyces sp. SID13031]NEA35961.1 redoxin domain-containing protein [Streptomyces sp. SID13031]